METTGRLVRRVAALEQHRQQTVTTFEVLGPANEGGHCPDCGRPADRHRTIAIDRAERREDDAA